MDNVVQYLMRPRSSFSGSPGVVFPESDATVYHSESHDSERIVARINQRSAGTNFVEYHPYELDRVVLHAIPVEIIESEESLPDFVTDDAYRINGGRAPVTGVLEYPNPADPFRAEFNYGGTGAVLGEDNAFPPFISNTKSAYRSVGGKTGLNPLGELSDNPPQTEFVFNQWNTRLHKDFSGGIAGPADMAYLSQDAAYPDGEYALVATAESVDRDPLEKFVSEPVGVDVDNFRPYAELVEVKDAQGGVKYRRAWVLEDGKLVSAGPTVDEPLSPGGEYSATALFSEFMDYGQLQVEFLDPMNPVATQLPALKKTIYTGSFTLGVGQERDELRPLIITGRDAGANHVLKLDPGRRSGDGREDLERTINPALELTRDSTGLMQGVGGEDRFHTLRIDAASPIISYNKHSKNYSAYDYTCPGGIPERCGTEENPINITFSSVPFLYTDVGSGVREVRVYKDHLGGESPFPVNYNPGADKYAPFDAIMTLKDGKYVQVVTDNLGRSTTMYFRIDPVSPRNEMSNISISPPYETYSVYGVAVDTGSGLASLRMDRGGEASREAVFASSTTAPVNYGFSGLLVDTPNYYKFTIQDVAGLETPLQLMQFVNFGANDLISTGSSNAVLHRVSRVDLSSGPCVVTITSAPNDLEVPVGAVIADESPLVVSLAQHSDYTVSIPVPGKYMHGRLSVAVAPENGCQVEVFGASMLSLLLGPKSAVSRNGDEPAQFDLSLKVPEWEVRANNAQWPEGSLPDINVSGINGNSLLPAPPALHVNLPVEAPKGMLLELKRMTYDGLDLKAHIPYTGLSPVDMGRVRMLKHDNGTVSDITTGYEGNEILGHTLDNCTFTLVAPLDVFDKAGPITALNRPSGAVDLDGELYISTSTPLNLNATDVSSNSFALAGVATTYYLVDTEPSPACLATAYDPAAPGGTCANPVYAGAFTLPEGRHSIYHLGVDNLGNVGAVGVSSVAVDGTPPGATLEINGTNVAAGATAYVPAGAVLTLSATDYFSGGLQSGLATTYFLVDITPEECEYSDWSGGVDGVGSCENSFYSGPLTLPSGEHVVYYMAEDNVGNVEPLRQTTLLVGIPEPSLDTIAPVVKAWGRGVEMADGSTNYMLASDTVAVTATDDSGVALIHYALDAVFSTAAATAYNAPFTIAGGTHTLQYSAVDAAGNWADVRSAFLHVDDAAPAVSLGTLGVSFSSGSVLYLAPASSLTLSAVDEGAGMGELRWSVDGSTYSLTGAYAEFLLEPGLHEVVYSGADALGNAALAAALLVAVDTEAPHADAVAAGLSGADGWYVSPVSLTFVSSDALSGVAGAGYSLARDGLLISSGAYASGISVEEEGSYSYGYAAVDNVGNRGQELAGAFKIDRSSPVVVAYSTPAANAYGWNNAPVTAVFTGTDPVSGIAFCTADSTLGLEGFGLAADGYCVNNAGLVSNAAVAVNIDATAPVSTAAAAGTLEGGYYTGPVTVTLASTDALSGVGLLEYSLDGGSFAPYGGPLPVEADGVHSVALRATDLAGNQEAPQQLSFEIRRAQPDTAAPVTTARLNGVPLAGGATVYLTVADTITFTAEDASFVGTYYALDVAFTSSTALTYSQPFTVVRGTHTLRYRSVDAAGNAEAVQRLFLTVGLPLEVEHAADMGGYGTEPGLLNMPVDVALMPWNKSLHVADSLNFRVQRFSIYGQYLSSLGSFGAEPGQFGGLVQTAAGPSGVDDIIGASPLFVADPGNYRIQRFSHNGYALSFGLQGSGPGQFESLYSIAVDTFTNLVYATDDVLNRVQVFTATGTYQRTLGAAVLNRPRAIAVRAASANTPTRVYVVDSGNNRIAVFSATQYLGYWPGDFAGASGIHADAFGRVFISDERGWITVYTTSGLIIGRFGRAGSGPAEFNKPMGMCSDPAGYLYVADSLNDRVQKVRLLTEDRTPPAAVADAAVTDVTPYYAVLEFAAPGDDGAAGRAAWYDVRFGLDAISTAGQFEAAKAAHILEGIVEGGAAQRLLVSGLEPGHSYGVAVRTYDESGNYSQGPAVGVTTPVRIAEGRLIKYAGNVLGVNLGAGAPAVTSNVSAPSALAVSTSGELYVAGVPLDTDASFVLKVDPADNLTSWVAGYMGSGFSGDGGLSWFAKLNNPGGLALTPAGNLVIADSENNRLRVVDKASSIITTLAGSGSTGYTGDGGPAITALLDSPQRLSADAAGNLYFADTDNHVVRKIDAGGTITTIAGTGVAGYNGDGIPAAAAQLHGPLDAEADLWGNVYVAELTNRIRRIDGVTGVITTVAGDGTAAYAGEGVPAAGASVVSPTDVAIDPLGNIYFAERGAGRLRRIDTQGVLTTVAGGGTSTAYSGVAVEMLLLSPAAVAGDWERGVVYIADSSRVSALGIRPYTAVQSEVLVGGVSELSVVSTGTYNLIPVAAAELPAAAAVAAAQAGELKSGIYEISAVERAGEVGVTLRVGKAGVADPAALGIYRFDGVAWDSSTVVNQRVTERPEYYELSGLALNTSLFGVFAPVPEPQVPQAALTPSSGPIGVPFTIDGAGFGGYVAGNTVVLIGGATAPLTLWTDTQIKGTVPGALAAGSWPVEVRRGTAAIAAAGAFSVLTPELYAIIPTSGSIGIGFTLNGANFGNYVANYTRVLIGGTTCPLTLWTDSQIKGTVPGTLASGTYEVAVERELNGGLARSATVAFTLNAPSVAAVLPSSGAIGVPFTINGATFGNYVANYTKVLIGGTTCPLTLWTDTQIKGTVPGSLAAGEHELTVVRELNGGLVTTLPVPFTVLLPDWSAVMPSSGPIGLPFTLNGANFGNYVANYTRVLIGGAAAPLTLWTDGQIKGTVPGTLAEGPHEAYVERALNGGVVRSSTFTFTVGAPVVTSVSPSTAAVIAPFTITGYNFGNYVANYTKVLIGGATCPLTLWTETKIEGKLPFLPAGEYPVLVQRNLNGGLNESATAYITVVEPVISSMTPQSGAVGTVFNLYGTGFGPYDASIAKVFIGGTQCALSLWTDTQIRGTVPAALSYGTHTVVAMRGGASSNALEFYIPVYTPSLLRAGALSQEFRLGEVYVYPDPAKGGKVPTFHIEVGTADTVKLRIFTVAGQLAHERVLTGEPQAVGAGYAYEYAWQGRIASGVYYYTVEAERTGRKMKARGKFAVVR
ncbi:MAG: IPT/TIG domain-containing protein [Elusimicrobiales bacterium]|nr:IPT/TIG domain-containing protein [Elusimicrobiales bacterium]